MAGRDHNETETVQRMFAAFAAGDLDALIETVHPKSTGQAFHNEWAQKYVVEDGLIVEMAEWNIQTEPR